MLATERRILLRRAAAMALGGASLAWDPKPSGVFDSGLCIRILDELMGAIDLAFRTELEAKLSSFRLTDRLLAAQQQETTPLRDVRAAELDTPRPDLRHPMTLLDLLEPYVGGLVRAGQLDRANRVRYALQALREVLAAPTAPPIVAEPEPVHILRAGTAETWCGSRLTGLVFRRTLTGATCDGCKAGFVS